MFEPEQSARQALEVERETLTQLQDRAEEFDTADLERQIEELRAKVAEKKAAAWDVTRELRAQRRKVESAERLLSVEEEQNRQVAQVATAHLDMEHRTLSNLWRETALPHQLEGSTFMAFAQRVLCADSMGLGKTRQSLMTADKLGARKILVVCPGEVMSGFHKEFSTYSRRRVVVLGRRPKPLQLRAMKAFAAVKEVTAIVNYEAWRKSPALLTALIEARFDMVIVDEAHTIKETTSNAYKGIKRILEANNVCPCCGDKVDHTEARQVCECGWDSWYPQRDPKDESRRCADVDRRSAKNLLCMTGTPILNRPEEIFASLHLINPEVFPTKASFIYDYCERYSTDGQAHFRSGGQEALARKIRPYYLRRTQDDAGIVLPPKYEQVHSIEFDPETYPLQAEIMTMIEKEAQIKLSETQAIPVLSMLAMLTRSRQAAIWPGGIYMDMLVTDENGLPVFELNEHDEWEQKVERVHVGANYQESQKLDYATDLIWEQVDGGHRVVVFSQFNKALKEQARRLEQLGVSVVCYDGDTPAKLREEIKTNFDRSYGEEPRWNVVLCHYRTGGVGLNLTAVTQAVVLDEEWNPGKNHQAHDRIWRMGQTSQVGIHILRMTKHIDTWMAALNQRKADLIAGFNETMDDEDLAKMLRELLNKQDEMEDET